MSGVDKEKLELAREIAEGLTEPSKEIAFAIIALFLGDVDDLKRAKSNIPDAKLVYLKVLLFGFGAEREARDILSDLSGEDQIRERGRAEAAFIDFLFSRGKLIDAKERLSYIRDPEWKARAIGLINGYLTMENKRMASKIEELQRKLALANPGDA